MAIVKGTSIWENMGLTWTEDLSYKVRLSSDNVLFNFKDLSWNVVVI